METLTLKSGDLCNIMGERSCILNCARAKEEKGVSEHFLSCPCCVYAVGATLLENCKIPLVVASEFRGKGFLSLTCVCSPEKGFYT